MAKLADVDAELRIVLKLLAVVGTIVVLIFIFIRGWVIAQEVFFPPPPAPPDEKFGEIAKVPNTPDAAGIDYRINTVSGTLPNYSDRMLVYKIVRNEPNLVALRELRDKLAPLGFSFNEIKVGESTYQWTNATGSRIDYNLLTDNFKLTSNFLNEPPPSGLTGRAATEEGAYDTVMNFLTNLGQDTSDLSEVYKVTMQRLENGQLVDTTDRNAAQFFRIDLYQNNINENYRILYPSANRSIMYFVVKSDVGSLPAIVDANFTHYILDTQDPAVYPIKTVQQAFDELQKGNAAVYNASTNTSIDITDVTIGYFVGEEDQEYAIPVIVFVGNGFIAYVNAIQ